MKFVVVQGCPVPAQLAPILETILKESGSHLNSCYRGDQALELLHRLGKHSQRELYEGYLHREPGFLPANPPSRSTHELFNDGVAYPGPAGAPLKWWQCGIDVNDSDVIRFEAVAERHGWTVTRTYPASRLEYHHLNFRKLPILSRPGVSAAVRRTRLRAWILAQSARGVSWAAIKKTAQWAQFRRLGGK